MALINGVAYSYSHIGITLAGMELVSASSINYEESQEKTNNYGLGAEPISRGYGTKEYTASVELTLGEAQILRDKAKELNPTGNGSLVDLPPFDIIVTFDNGVEFITHSLISCEFTKDGFSGSTGDTELKESFDLIVAAIRFK